MQKTFICFILFCSVLLATGANASTDLRTDMRKVWEEHVLWTRNFIISSLADAPDKAAVTQRLLQNQKDIGKAIEPYYGTKASEKLTALLTEHILIAGEIVTLAKLGASTSLDLANKRWEKNSDEISTFLHNANPENWPLAHMKHMMRTHLSLTADELNARIKKDWKADVAAYDKIHNEILVMADDLTEGIMKQFPKK